MAMDQMNALRTVLEQVSQQFQQHALEQAKRVNDINIRNIQHTINRNISIQLKGEIVNSISELQEKLRSEGRRARQQ